jgi:hypothetical protein
MHVARKHILTSNADSACLNQGLIIHNLIVHDLPTVSEGHGLDKQSVLGVSNGQAATVSRHCSMKMVRFCDMPKTALC